MRAKALGTAVLGALLAAPWAAAVERPVLLAPSGVVADVTPSFRWTASSGAATYDLTLSTHADFADAQQVLGLSATSYDLTSGLGRGATYFWKINAVKGDLSILARSFRGSFYLHPAVLYELQVSTQAGFGSLSVDRVGLSSSAHALEGFEALPAGATYYWRVRCTDFVNGTPVFNQFNNSFFVLTSLGSPVLSAPADRGLTSSLAPSFSWTSVPGASSYTLEASRYADFSILAVSSAGIPGTSYQSTLADGLRPGRYFWRVAATDGTSVSRSAVSSFTIDRAAPAAFALSYPPPGGLVSDRSLGFFWLASTDPAGVAYTLELAKTASFSPLAFSAGGLSTASFVLSGALDRGATYYWRVRAGDGLGNERVAGPRSFVMAPEVAYALELSTSPTMAAPLPVNQAGISSSAYALSDAQALVFETTYYWRVRADDQAGNGSVYSSTFSFQVSQVLAAPALLAPADQATVATSSPAFSWSSVTGASSYRLEVSTVPDFSSTQVSSAGILGTSYQSRLEDGISEGAPNYWRVRATDGTNATLSSTATFRVFLARSPAAAARPELLRPLGLISDRTPTFEWTPTTGAASYRLTLSQSPDLSGAQVVSGIADRALTLAAPLARAATYYWRVEALRGDNSVLASSFKAVFLLSNSVRYTLEIDTTTALAAPLAVARADIASSAATLANYEALASGSTYFWRVRAVDPFGASVQSSTFSFRVEPALASPALVSPPDLSFTNSVVPLFVWTPVPSALSYTLEVSRFADFSTLLVSSAGILGTSYQATAANGLRSGTFHWRVRATDGVNASLSPPASFTIDLVRPSPFALVLPPSGGVSTDKSVSFLWEASTDASGVTYRLEVATAPSFALLVLDQPGLMTTFFAGPELARGATYYWRVRAEDAVGNARYAGLRTFVLRNAVSYDLEVDTTAALAAPMSLSRVGVASSAYTPTLAEALADETTYFWRLRATDLAGNGSVLSSTFSFAVSLPLGTPSLSNPADASTIDILSPLYQWSFAKGALSYSVQVSTDPAFGSLKLSSAGVTATSLATPQSDILSDNATYYWRVTATDGVQTTTSSVAFFLTRAGGLSTRPGRPVPLHPLLASADRTPTFVWTPSSGAASYALTVSRNPDLSAPLGFTGITTYFFTLSVPLERGATYFWKVAALKGDLSTLAESFRGSFFLSPAVRYDLLVDTAAAIAAPLSAERLALSSSSYALQGYEALAAGATYYWRVRGVDFLGGQVLSSTFSFSVTSPLASPGLLAPADFALVGSLTPAFAWTPVVGASSYTLVVSRFPDFASVAVSSAGILGTSYAASPADGLRPGRYFWRVSAHDGTNTAASAAASFTIDRAAPSPFALFYPPPGATLSDRSLGFFWQASTDPAGVAYTLELAKTASFAPLAVSAAGLSTTSFLLSGSLDRGATYYWRVRAGDGLGNERLSALRSFVLAPAVSYTLEVSTSEAVLAPLPVAQAGISSSAFALTDAQALALETTYYWRVRADDRAGNGSVYSSTFSFRTTPALAAPALLAPADLAIVNTSSPAFSWSSVGGATSYQLEVATVASFTSLMISSAGILGTTYQSALEEGLQDGVVHYWRVRATDGTNATASGAFTFSISLPRAPPAAVRPELLRPLGLISDRTPSFEWTPATGAASYRLSLSQSPDLSGALVVSGITQRFHTLAAPLARSSTYYWRVEALRGDNSVLSASFKTVFLVTHAVRYALEVDTSAVVAAPLAVDRGGLEVSSHALEPGEALGSGKTYFWRVRAEDLLGGSVLSSTFSFQISLPLASPVLAAPFDGSFTDSLTPVFSWSAVPGAASYQLEVSRVPDFATLLVSSAGIPGTSYASTVFDRLGAGRQFWRVRATDGLNASVSSPFSFTIDRAAPGPFALVYPPAGGRVSDRSVTFAWSASTDSSGLSYRLELADNAQFSPLLSLQSGLTDTTATSPSLDRGTTYYWRVSASDLVGHSRQSPRRAFVVPNDVLYVLEVDSTPVHALPYVVSRSSISPSRYALESAEALSFGFVYHWRVRAEDQQGLGAAVSSTFSFNTDGTPPSAITDLRASSRPAFGQVRLDWTSPGDNGLSGTINEGAFVVQFTTDTAWSDGNLWSTNTAQTPSQVFTVTLATSGAAPGSAQSKVLDSLLGGGTFFFRAWARDRAGNYSPLSNATTAPTLTAPAGVTTPSFTGVGMDGFTLNWTSGTPGTGYNVPGVFYHSSVSTAPAFSTATVAPQTQNPFAFYTGLFANSTYYARVSTNPAGPFTFLGSTATLATPPLSAGFFSTSHSSITASWAQHPFAPTSATAEGYRLEISPTPDFSGEIFFSSTTDITNTVLTVYGLNSGTFYTARVGSLNWNRMPNYTVIGTTRTSGGTCDPILSVQSGAWSSLSTWADQRQPIPCAPVTVAEGHLVTVDTLGARASTVTVQGVLAFSQAANTKLTISGGDVTVKPGGRLELGAEGSPIPNGIRAELALAGGTLLTQKGLIVENGGALSVRGGDKAPWAYAAGDAPAGATGMSVAVPGAGAWAAGDTVAIAKTGLSSDDQTEYRTLLTVAGAGPTTISWAEPLSFSHYSTGPLLVANLTRSAVIRSSEPAKPAYIQNLSLSATSFVVAYGELAYLGLNSGSRYGVVFDGAATKGSISSSTVRDGFIGVYLNAGHGAVLESNLVCRNLNVGLYSFGASSGSLSGNLVFSNQSHGLFLANGTFDVRVAGNAAFANSGSGLFATGSTHHNTISANRLASNFSSGLSLAAGAHHNSLVSNLVHDNSNAGIVLSNAPSTTLSVNRVARNLGAGVSLASSPDAWLEGNHAESNLGAGISASASPGLLGAGNRVWANAGEGLRLAGVSDASWTEGVLGYDEASAPAPDGAAEVFLDAGGAAGVILKTTRLEPAHPLSPGGLDKPGNFVVSYNQGYDTGSVRLHGDYAVSGGSLTLDHATALYASTASLPRAMRGSSILALTVGSTSDAEAVTQLVSVVYRAADGLWHVAGSSQGAFGTLSAGGGSGAFPAGSPQFTMSLSASGVQDGDRGEFLLTAASKDAGRQKKLLFGPSSPAFNSGRSRLTVAPGAALVLKGVSGTPALMDRLDASSTYYTVVDSGAFTAAYASIQNTDPAGVQLSGAGPVLLSTATFDYLGIAGGTNAYITARSLTSQATFYSVTFGTSRSTEGAPSAYNVRVEGSDSGLAWSFRGELGGLWGEARDSDPNDKVRWRDQPPSSPTVTAVFASSITVGWALLDTDGYSVLASTAADLTGAVFSSATSRGGAPALSPQGLDPNTTYFLRAGALWASVTTYAPTVLSSATLARAVTGTQVLTVHLDSVTVAWDALAVSPASDTAEGYRLEASTKATFVPLLSSSATASVSESTLTIAGLAPGATYFFRVGSLNWNGQPNYAVTVSTRVPGSPRAVTDLAAAASTAAAITLSWSAPGADQGLGFLDASTFTVRFTTVAVFASSDAWTATGTVPSFVYTVSVATSGVAPGALSQLEVAGLDPNTTHYFRLWTTNARGLVSPLSNGATVSTLADPVSNAQLQAVFASSAAVSWTPLPLFPSSRTAEGYRVQASTMDTFVPVFSSTRTLDPAAGVLTVTGLTAGPTFYFRVGSLNWSGAANYSVAGSTRLGTQPGAVTDLAAAARDAARVELSWTAPAPGLPSTVLDGQFVLQYTADAAFAQWDPGGQVPPQVYTVFLATTGVVPGTRRSWLQAGLDPNTTYFFRVWAQNSGGLYGGLSNPATAATFAVAPAGVAVEGVFFSSIAVSWTALPASPPAASSQTAEGYRLEVSTRSDFSPLSGSSATASVEASTLSVSSLLGGVTYYFRVGSLNWVGASSFSVTVSTLLPAQLGVVLSTRVLTLPGLVDMADSLVISTSILATNTGNVAETYSLSAATATPGSPWAVAASTGIDRLVLWSVFNGAPPAAQDFGSEDRLSEADAAATGTAFTAGGETAVAIPPGQTRRLWLKLATPAATSTADPQQIEIRATAGASP